MIERHFEHDASRSALANKQISEQNQQRSNQLECVTINSANKFDLWLARLSVIKNWCTILPHWALGASVCSDHTHLQNWCEFPLTRLIQFARLPPTAKVILLIIYWAWANSRAHLLPQPAKSAERISAHMQLAATYANRLFHCQNVRRSQNTKHIYIYIFFFNGTTHPLCGKLMRKNGAHNFYYILRQHWTIVFRASDKHSILCSVHSNRIPLFHVFDRWVNEGRSSI